MLQTQDLRPKVREVDFFPVRKADGVVIALRDPLDFSPQVLAFQPVLLPVIALMDGEHTLDQIAKKVHSENKIKISLEQLQEVVQKLDDAYFLANDHFKDYVNRVIAEYRACKTRLPAHAGVSYPEDADEVHAYFSDHFLGGPGFPRLGAQEKPPRALIIPHIDLRIGGPSFAWCYKSIAESKPVDLFVILGTAHFPTRFPFCATRKDFLTPLGLAKTDGDFLDRLSKDLPFDLFSDEFAHRNEHSIEFQVVYLQSVLPFEGPPPTIVPILCGSFFELMKGGKAPDKDEKVGAFIQALKREIEAEHGKRNVCVIASVDLAHVGGRFGDDNLRLSLAERNEFEKKDLAMLDHVLQGDAGEFFKFIAHEEDRRRVCGFPAIYTMLQTLSLEHGQLLNYDQSFEKMTNSLVTFCAVKFS